MLLDSAAAALRQTLSPAMRGILWKSLGLTLGILIFAWFGLTRLIQAFQANHHISSQYPILDSLAYYLAGFGLFVALAYLMPAISILVASFFPRRRGGDRGAHGFPQRAAGRAMPLGSAVLYTVRFAGVTLLVNLVALAIFFVPLVGVAAFFAANAYLLSREYFEMAAARFRPSGGGGHAPGTTRPDFAGGLPARGADDRARS